MQKKKVLLLTYGNRNHASSRIRALNHFDRLKDVYEATWIPRVSADHKGGFMNKLVFAIIKRFDAIKLWWTLWFGTFDIAFVQVRFLPEWALKVLKRKKTLLCYDFDDAVYTYSARDFELMMKYSDKVVVSTPYLKEHIESFKKECCVIFSPVNTNLILPLSNRQPVYTIGWIGSEWTIPYLQELVPVFKRFAESISIRLIVVGAEFNIPGVDVECIAWSEKNELDALGKIDVGIMPLKNDEWSKMKGGYKLYLYMAAGRPSIASPYGINADIIIAGGTGYFAQNEDEWLNAFEKLQNDLVLRRSMGLLARQEAEKKYSYNVCTQQLVDFLNS